MSMDHLRRALAVFSSKFESEPGETIHYGRDHPVALAGQRLAPWPEPAQADLPTDWEARMSEELMSTTTEGEATLVVRCGAYQASDQMICGCGLVWDMNDTDPPACPRTGERRVG